MGGAGLEDDDGDEGEGEDAGGDEEAVGDDDAGEVEDPSHWSPRAAVSAPRTTSRAAARILRIRVRRGAVGTRSL